MKNKIKKTLCSLICALMILSVISDMNISASEFIYMNDSVFRDSESQFGAYSVKRVSFESINDVAIIKASSILNGEIIIPALLGPETNTYLWSSSFSGCGKISSIIVPEHVRFISVNAFHECFSLEKIVFYSDDTLIFDDPDTIIDSATIYGKLNSTAHKYAQKYNREFIVISDYDIPSKCGGLENGCSNIIQEDVLTFNYCPHYNTCELVSADKTATGSVEIPDYAAEQFALTKICDNAFNGCTEITSVSIGSEVEHIGKNAFAHCNSLDSVSFNLYSDPVVYDSADTFPEKCSFYSLGKRSEIEKYAKKYDHEYFWYLPLPLDPCNGVHDGCNNKSETNGFSYSFCPHNNDASLLNTDSSYSGKVILPSYFDNYLLGCLGSTSFEKCNRISYLVIPETVSVIHEEDIPFLGDCKSLRLITFLNPNCNIPEIPEGVTICGFVNSTAHLYASEHNSEFIAISTDMNINVDYDNKDKITIIDTQEIIKIDNTVFVKPDITIGELKDQSSNISQIIDKDGNNVTDSQRLGSGMVLLYKDKNENVIDSVTIIIPGDNDGDGSITSSDARTALRASVQLEELNQWQTTATDVDDFSKNEISSSDARYILRTSVGLESLDGWFASNLLNNIS